MVTCRRSGWSTWGSRVSTTWSNQCDDAFGLRRMVGFAGEGVSFGIDRVSTAILVGLLGVGWNEKFAAMRERPRG